MKAKRTKNRKIIFTATAMAMVLLLILPFAITPTVSLQAAESYVAKNVMAGPVPPQPKMPTWTEGGSSLSSSTFTNMFTANGNQSTAIIFTDLAALDGHVQSGRISYDNGNPDTQDQMFGIRISNQPLSAFDDHYKSIVITLTSSTQGSNKIQLYLKPDGPNAYIIREWGSGETAGKIITYNGGAGIEIEFNRGWLVGNTPQGTGITYTINVSGIVANSGSIQFKFIFTANGSYGVTGNFGGGNSNQPADYPTVFTGTNRPWHDGTPNTPWPYWPWP